jgi:UDP-N-acetylglucosamine diphosphorylase / glucose-1-phosphate thymidylyltransferase / UDP-N-acetylgalactosamine diphosphorylase / glucosamine-1-phosphate N-acetyltransferase / galactosamine-1-phosphate N-acetyltransferase
VTTLYLLEPAARGLPWAPFEGVRPVSELRAGVPLIRQRWERALGLRAAAILSNDLTGFHEFDEPPVQPAGSITGPAIVAASWFAPTGRIRPAAGARRLTAGSETVAWIVPDQSRWDGPDDAGPAVPADGLLLRGASDLLTALDTMLAADCDALLSAASGTATPPTGALILGDAGRVLVRDATVEPGVVFDVRRGAVIVEPGAEVRHGTRLEGPCYVGRDCRVLGGFIRSSVFGPRCVVRGEIAASSFIGYANKSHDGFVGNSVVGHWVNLGAGTTTSNLKNTYGPVRLDIAGRRVETGRTNVGSLIGDHAKTAIGTLLSTGTIIGAGASVFGGEPVPRYVVPFAWGAGNDQRQSEEGFLRIAERVMPRRDVPFTDERRRSLSATYRRLTDGA